MLGPDSTSRDAAVQSSKSNIIHSEEIPNDTEPNEKNLRTVSPAATWKLCFDDDGVVFW